MTEIEYKLFVNLISKRTSIETIRTMIEKWRKLNEAHQESLIEKFHVVPTIKELTLEGYSCTKHNRTETINKNYSYQKNFLTFSGLYLEDENVFCLREEIKKDLLSVAKRFVPIDFKKSKENWYHFYGIPHKESTAFESLKHGIESLTKSKNTSFKESLKEAKKILKKELQENHSLSKEEEKTLEDLIYEREIEDIYSQHTNWLESGLKLIRNGRQYSTIIGRIDMLCQDAEGHYVVVEIKRGTAEDKAIGQILRYIGWVHQNLDHRRGHTRGIILSESFSDTIKFSRIGLLKKNAEQFIQLKKVQLKPEGV